MKLKFIKLLVALFFVSVIFDSQAQKTKPVSSKQTTTEYPVTFTISKKDFDNLLSGRSKEIVSLKTNKYLDKGEVVINTLNGDTKFIKIKLNYFHHAFLTIQVNGEYSTQIFILSDDKSVFYKGLIEKDVITLTKCNEDEIVSE